MELFFASENTAFSVALAFMVLVLILEVFSSGILSGMLDALIPDIDLDVDIDADMDADADISGGADIPALSKIFIWTKDRVPMLVYFIIFLTVFSSIGFITQYYVKRAINHYLPWFFIVPSAFILSVLISRYISKLLSKIAFKDETTAVSSDSFIGSLATITTNVAKKGRRVEARLTDKHGQIHYVFIEPEEKGAEFKVGEEVLLTRKENDTFKCVENELTERN